MASSASWLVCSLSSAQNVRRGSIKLWKSGTAIRVFPFLLAFELGANRLLGSDNTLNSSCWALLRLYPIPHSYGIDVNIDLLA